MTPEKRFEIKFCLRLDHFETILGMLKFSRHEFRKIFPNRTIHNRYFDSEDLTLFNLAESGVSERKKVRIRWYDENPNAQCQLEFKIKEANLGYKRSYLMHDFKNIPHGLILNQYFPCFDAKSAQEITPYGQLSYKLFNQYQRSYYRNRQENITITFDKNLEFRSPLKPTGIRHPAEVIMEIKFAPELVQQVQDITNQLPIRRRQFSKYTQGIHAIYGLED